MTTKVSVKISTRRCSSLPPTLHVRVAPLIPYRGKSYLHGLDLIHLYCTYSSLDPPPHFWSFFSIGMHVCKHTASRRSLISLASLFLSQKGILSPHADNAYPPNSVLGLASCTICLPPTSFGIEQKTGIILLQMRDGRAKTF